MRIRKANPHASLRMTVRLSAPQRLKPRSRSCALRSAEAPLFHGIAVLWYILVSTSVDTLYPEIAHADSADCEVGEQPGSADSEAGGGRGGVREGDPIVIEVAAGEISLRRKRRIPTLRELVAQITPENRYDEIATGAERGKESVEW